MLFFILILFMYDLITLLFLLEKWFDLTINNMYDDWLVNYIMIYILYYYVLRLPIKYCEVRWLDALWVTINNDKLYIIVWCVWLDVIKCSVEKVKVGYEKPSGVGGEIIVK